MLPPGWSAPSRQAGSVNGYGQFPPQQSFQSVSQSLSNAPSMSGIPCSTQIGAPGGGPYATPMAVNSGGYLMQQSSSVSSFHMPGSTAPSPAVMSPAPAPAPCPMPPVTHQPSVSYAVAPPAPAPVAAAQTGPASCAPSVSYSMQPGVAMSPAMGLGPQSCSVSYVPSAAPSVASASVVAPAPVVAPASVAAPAPVVAPAPVTAPAHFSAWGVRQGNADVTALSLPPVDSRRGVTFCEVVSYASIASAVTTFSGSTFAGTHLQSIPANTIVQFEAEHAPVQPAPPAPPAPPVYQHMAVSNPVEAAQPHVIVSNQSGPAPQRNYSPSSSYTPGEFVQPGFVSQPSVPTVSFGGQPPRPQPRRSFSNDYVSQAVTNQYAASPVNVQMPVQHSGWQQGNGVR
mmetsp:Transcript_44251/g.117281  ORF Transcript_44251/g.117281 Transcript_44251/m.117281 type:complete len:399 (-) Transcript_44251:186-1382(-)